MTSQQDTELDQESEHALILETAYNLGYHKIKDGCLQEPLKELNKLISSKVNEAVIRELESLLHPDLWTVETPRALLTIRDRIRTLKNTKLDQLKETL